MFSFLLVDKENTRRRLDHYDPRRPGDVRKAPGSKPTCRWEPTSLVDGQSPGERLDVVYIIDEVYKELH